MDIRTAAAYIRVSTEDQTEYSPDAQLRELREYAAAHGLILDDRFIYADEGISGRKADKRPAFQEMIRTAKQKDHPFDVILVHKFDRFARSREDSVVYKSMLKRCGVEVVSIKEPLAEGSYAGVMEAIYESFAEAYSINLGTEVRKGMTEKALRGEIQTAPPYGYMLAPVAAHISAPPSPSSSVKPPLSAIGEGDRRKALEGSASPVPVGAGVPDGPSPTSPVPVGRPDPRPPSPVPVGAGVPDGPHPASPVQSLPLEGKVSPVRTLVTDEVVSRPSPSPSAHTSRTFVPHPVEAPYVRELFVRFAAGEGLFPLAKWMNDCGQRTHRGGRFENRTVEYILRNPIYIGKVRWNPKRRSRRDYDDPDLMIVQGSHEPLITPELWSRVQERIAEVKALHPYHGRPAADRHHWLCGIVRCAACGATLIWSKPCYLKCNNYVRGRCSHTQHIKAELLEQTVIAQLKAHVLAGDAPAPRLISKETPENQARKRILQQLEANRKRQDRLLEALLNGAQIPVEQYNKLSADLKSEEASLRAELSVLDQSAVPTAAEQSAALRAQLAATLATLESSDATTAQKHEAASALIDRCTFDKDRMTLEITYRLTV